MQYDLVKMYQEGCSLHRLSYLSNINEKELRQMLVSKGVRIRGRAEGMTLYKKLSVKEFERENKWN